MDGIDLDLQMNGEMYKTWGGLYNFDSVLNDLREHKIQPNKKNNRFLKI